LRIQVLTPPAQSPVVVEKCGVSGFLVEQNRVNLCGSGIVNGGAGSITDFKPCRGDVELEVRKVFVADLSDFKVASSRVAVLLQQLYLA
jgi:hypothetical protein